MTNINQLLKMARQLQAQALKLKEEIESREFEGSAGGGAVKAVAKGSGELVSLEISEELLSADKETLEDLIIVAVNQALKKARETLAGEMEKVAGGLGIDIGGLF